MNFQQQRPSSNVNRRSRYPDRGPGPEQPNAYSPQNDFVQVMITRDQGEMLQLLERYEIRQVSKLQLYLETEPHISVNVDGASTFANANRFSISGGVFSAVGGNQLVVDTHHSKDGSVDAQTLSMQQAITTASRYSEQGMINDGSTPQAVSGNIAQPETYPITNPGNPFRNPTSLQGSSGVTRAETRTSVSISGPNVLANASHFEFGEGVKMSNGALSAVAKNQFILEQGDSEQPEDLQQLES
ncbi:hypothetical protein C8J55DRAFT_524922 [Lentinula edodes]|uniref:Uncharacterized protein n=1 Tax=Lentinula lateritia TaxID=40482 RepID=A0A9W9DGH1_9AGAR|nr:hypothetical protein C8J55DRAFT_524922 [Lentinula edodes]